MRMVALSRKVEVLVSWFVSFIVMLSYDVAMRSFNRAVKCVLDKLGLV